MSKLQTRVFCPECGALRIRPHRSRYAVCPKGHGRLVPRFTDAQRRKAIAQQLPRACRIGTNTFLIDGHPGQYAYRDGNGRRPATLGDPINADQVVARHVTGAGALIRVFTRKPSRARS